MAISEQEFEQAVQRGQEARAAGHVLRARYDKRRGRLVVELSTGVQLAVPVARLEGLAGADPDELGEIEISATGLGLHWPKLDADVYVPALMQGVFGSARWMAAQMGAAGGRVRSAAKSAAARENGAKGGRPRKAG
jgi:hypothetical protein